MSEPRQGNGDSALQIEFGGRTTVVAPSEEATIGRDDTNTVQCDDALVSRTHALARATNGVWEVADVGSRNGIFVNGARVQTVTIDAPVSVRLGSADGGPELHLTLVSAETPPTDTGAGSVSASAVGDDVLRLRCAEREYEFTPGRTITIGRDPACDVVCENPLVSRQHAVFRFDDNHWVIEDTDSRRGIFWDGHQIKSQELRGAMTLFLGPEDAGEKLLVVTTGTTPRSRRSMLLAGAVATAVIAVAIAVIALVAGGGGGSGSRDLTALRRATVRIEYQTTEDGQTFTHFGSGTIVSEDGLILTNAHVAAPGAPGRGVDNGGPALDDNPERVVILMNNGGDEPARPRYQARLVGADGYLDLAVLQIDRTKAGARLSPDSLDLPFVPLGDSDEVHSGDEVLVLGYPANVDTDAVNITRGIFGSVVKDPNKRVKGRFQMNVDAQINGGNSGGLAVDADGRIVGVPTQVTFGRRGESAIGQVRLINLAKPIIEAATEKRRYNAYRYVQPLTGDEKATGAGFAVQSDGCGKGRVAAYTGGPQGAIADFLLAGVRPGTDLWAGLVGSEGLVAQRTQVWKGSSEGGCGRFQLFSDSALPAGAYRVILATGPNYDQQLAVQSVAVR